MKKYENLAKQALTILSLLWVSIVAAQSQDYSTTDLTEAANRWLAQQLPTDTALDIAITPLDSRIGSKSCSVPLAFSLSQPLTQRQNTIQIRCSDDNSWQLYVPVRIDEILTAVVLSQNIATGSRLTADMVQLAERQRRFVRGTPVTDPTLVLGAKAKKALAMGQILTLQDLCLVCKGDVVTISVADKGLNVAATGVALSDGSLGDSISVQNQQSRRTIQVQVTGVDRVSVIF
ncbi:flagellar basal body P-ring formation chaperone FlgA [Rheinheimera sp. FR7-31]|uniref:flagellar basal body P-ring formation chaperone FlgA n=1 Tax=Rheinheimera fenheensis TaxID=3152295 RepID=UPI00325D8AA1